MNYFWKQTWPLANSRINSKNTEMFLSTYSSPGARSTQMPEIFTFINPMEKQFSEIPKGKRKWLLNHFHFTLGKGMHVLASPSMQGQKKNICSHRARSTQQEMGMWEMLRRKQWGERRGRLGWLKARVQPSKAMNIHSAHINKDTQSCNVLTNPSPSQNASCNLKI